MFREITTCDYYGMADSLDGKKPIEEGPYTIIFPDGYVSASEYVFVEKESKVTQVDMSGPPDHHVAYNAYLKRQEHGIQYKLYLRKTGVKLYNFNEDKKW